MTDFRSGPTGVFYSATDGWLVVGTRASFQIAANVPAIHPGYTVTVDVGSGSRSFAELEAVGT